MQQLADAYRLLDVASQASAEEIRKAYLVLVNVWHPDRFVHDRSLQAHAEDRLKTINLAYEAIRHAPLRPAPKVAVQEPAGVVMVRSEPTAASASPKSPQEWFQLGSQLTRNPVRLPRGDALHWSDVSNLNQIVEGIRAFKEAVRLKPNFAEAWFRLGLAHVQISEHAPALNAFSEAVRSDPRHGLAWINLGTAYSRQGRHDDVARSFERAVELRPGDASAWFTLATTYVRLERTEDAIRAYHETVRIDPSLGEAWYALGMALAFPAQAGARVEPEDAVTAFRTATRVKPDLADAWNRLGAVLNGLRRYDDAIVALREAVRLEPDASEAWFNLGVAARHSKCVDARRLVAEAYDTLARLRPDEAARFRELLPYPLRLLLVGRAFANRSFGALSAR